MRDSVFHNQIICTATKMLPAATIQRKNRNTCYGRYIGRIECRDEIHAPLLQKCVERIYNTRAIKLFFHFFETNNSFLTIQTNLLVVVYLIYFNFLKFESLFAIHNNFYMLL